MSTIGQQPGNTPSRPSPMKANSQAGPSTAALSPRLPSSPVLLLPLPPASSITSESLAQSELELDKQQRDVIREKALAEALQEQEWEIQRQQAKESIGTIKSSSSKSDNKAKGGGTTSGAFTKPPQAYELYAAIDRHDIDFIMRVRDHAFNLLLQKNAGEFPIVYAARQGEKHRDVVILLIGAMSRYVEGESLWLRLLSH